MKKNYKLLIKQNFKRFLLVFIMVYYLKSSNTFFNDQNNKINENIERSKFTTNEKEKPSDSTTKLIYKIDEITSINDQLTPRGGESSKTNLALLWAIIRVGLAKGFITLNKGTIKIRPTPKKIDIGEIQINEKLNQNKREQSFLKDTKGKNSDGGKSRKMTRAKFDKSNSSNSKKGTTKTNNRETNRKTNRELPPNYVPMNRRMIDAFKDLIDGLEMTPDQILDLIFDHRTLKHKPKADISEDEEFLVKNNDLQEARTAIYAYTKGILFGQRGKEQAGELQRPLGPREHRRKSTRFYDCDFELITKIGRILVDIKEPKGKNFGKNNSDVVMSAMKLCRGIKKQYDNYKNDLGYNCCFVINIEALNLHERAIYRRHLSGLPSKIIVKVVDLTGFVGYKDLTDLL